MSLIRSDAVADHGIITIPPRYADTVVGAVSVIAHDGSPDDDDAHMAEFETHMAAIRAECAIRPASIEDFKTFSIDTTDWKFDREAIHEMYSCTYTRDTT